MFIWSEYDYAAWRATTKTMRTHCVVFGYWFLAVLVAPNAHAQVNGESDLVPYSLDPNKACGPLCVAFLERYYGGNKSYGEITRFCVTGSQGTSLADLQRTARELGYATRSFEAGSEQLKHLVAPAILHLKGRSENTHFIVLLSWNEATRQFYVFDPPQRLLNLSEEDLINQFTGIGLLVAERPPPGSVWLAMPSPSTPLWVLISICALDVIVIVLFTCRRWYRHVIWIGEYLRSQTEAPGRHQA